LKKRPEHGEKRCPHREKVHDPQGSKGQIIGEGEGPVGRSGASWAGKSRAWGRSVPLSIRNPQSAMVREAIGNKNFRRGAAFW